MLKFSSSPKLLHQLQPGGLKAGQMEQGASRSLESLTLEVKDLFERHLRIEALLSISKKIRGELKERLQFSPQSMLPSHNYTLPTGQEQGIYLALEVGGSTLRVALVELGRKGIGQERLRVRCKECSPIDASVRQLKGLAFFDWIAERIRDMLAMASDVEWREPLRMGIAWSFPVE